MSTELDFSDRSAWEIRPGVPVFDAHDEHGPDGRLVRSFTQGDLEEIAETCNLREEATGDACPLTLGHTRPDLAEKDQPEIVGYARNFRVGPFGADDKPAILADFYFRKERAAEALTYPRRSVELWVKDKVIDPIALLRRTPQRDLGLLAFARPADGRIRYQLEEQTVDQNEQAAANQDPDALSPDEAKMADKFWKHYAKNNPVVAHMAKQYQAAQAAPPAAPPAAASPTNAPPPAAKAEPEGDDAKRMARDQGAIEVARYQRANEELQTRLASLERESRVARYERDLGHLISQGYQFKMADELKDCQDLSAEQFAKHCDRIKSNYRRIPVGADWVPVAAKADPDLPTPDGSLPGVLSQEQADRALSYMRSSGKPWDECVQHIRGGGSK